MTVNNNNAFDNTSSYFPATCFGSHKSHYQASAKTCVGKKILVNSRLLIKVTEISVEHKSNSYIF